MTDMDTYMVGSAPPQPLNCVEEGSQSLSLTPAKSSFTAQPSKPLDRTSSTSSNLHHHTQEGISRPEDLTQRHQLLLSLSSTPSPLSSSFSSSSTFATTTNHTNNNENKCPSSDHSTWSDQHQQQLLQLISDSGHDHHSDSQGFAQDTLHSLSTLMAATTSTSTNTYYNNTGERKEREKGGRNNAMLTVAANPVSNDTLPLALPRSCSSTPPELSSPSTPNATDNNLSFVFLPNGSSSPPCALNLTGPVSSLLPLVGRDFLSYGNLSALAAGTLSGENKPRPLSSMEFAESFLPTAVEQQQGSVSSATERAKDSNLCNPHPGEDISLGRTETDHARTTMAQQDVSGNGTRLSSDQHSIHPLDAGCLPSPTSPCSSSPYQPLPMADSTAEGWLSDHEQNHQYQHHPHPLEQHPNHQVIRKKTSLASKLRKVFVLKPQSSHGHATKDMDGTRGAALAQSLEDIISMTSRDDSGILSVAPAGSGPLSLLDQHRGSVSSASSAETTGGQGDFNPSTPMTSPEVSPSGSPKLKPSALTQTYPPSHPTHPSQAAILEPAQAMTAPDMIRPNPTRTVKKRLSFASITSFFTPRQGDAQDIKKKQHRSSSVPNVENPLLTVGRQIAGFQRRHSLNDLHSPSSSLNKHQQQQPLPRLVAPPWDKDLVSAQAASAAAEAMMASTAPAPTSGGSKRLNMNAVFGRQHRKKSASGQGAAPTTSHPSAASKPLRSALVHRPQRNNSYKQSPSMRSQRSLPGHGPESLLAYAGDAGATGMMSNSRRNSQDLEGRAAGGPTRHRRENSLAGRQANQEGHYSGERKQRLSVRYSSSSFSTSEEYDMCSSSQSIEFSECAHSTVSNHETSGAFTPQEIAALQCRETSCLTAPATPRVLPVATKSTAAVRVPIDQVNQGHTHSSSSSHSHNPLATLSPTSSCCSFSSASNPETSHVSSMAGSPLGHSDEQTSLDLGTTDSRDVVYTSLLPTAAARVSVDQIAMERSSVDSSRLAYTVYQSQHQQQQQHHQYYHPQQQQQEHLHLQHLHQLQLQHQQQQSKHTYPSYPHHYLPEHHHHLQRSLMTPPQHLYNTPPTTLTSPVAATSSDPSLFSTYQYPPRPPRQLQFSMDEPLIHPTWTPEQYDRSSDPHITAHRLTPAMAQKIKLELNHFKSQEMLIHQESRVHTHFFT